MENRFAVFVTSIMSIHRSVQKIKSAEMGELGLKGNHAMCLFQLYHHPEGLTVTELGGLCFEDKAAVSRSVAVLEFKGLIRRPETGKGRAYRRRLMLTETGLETARYIDDLSEAVVDRVGGGLTPEERTIFYKSLAEIAGKLNSLVEENEK